MVSGGRGRGGGRRCVNQSGQVANPTPTSTATFSIIASTVQIFFRQTMIIFFISKLPNTTTHGSTFSNKYRALH